MVFFVFIPDYYLYDLFVINVKSMRYIENMIQYFWDYSKNRIWF